MNGRIWAMGAGLAAMALAGCGGSSSNGGTGGGTEATTVTITFTGAMPTAVATKIGSGAFAAVTPLATVTLEIPSGTTDFSVAYVCPAISVTVGEKTVLSSGERILNASTTDGTSYTELCATSATDETTGTLTASVDATALVGTTNILLQALSGSTTTRMSLLGDPASNMSMAAPVGNDWVGVLAYDSAVSTETGGFSRLLGAKVFLDQAVPGTLNGGDPVVLTEADAATLEPLNFSNVPAGYGTPYAQVNFMPAGQKASVLMTSGATTSYPTMPAAAGGGTYQIVALANAGGGSSSQNTGLVAQFVGVQQTLTAAGPVSVSFPAAWSYAGPAAAALPTFEFNYAGFSSPSKPMRTGTITWTGSGQAGVSIGVTSTVAYGGGSAFVAVPDLSGLAGFTAKPASGTMVTWIAAVESGGSSSASGSPGAASGTSTQMVESMGFFLVP